MQQRFAYQNLENRLAFEKGKTKLDGKLDQSALDRLRQLESMLRNRGREAALKNLHDGKVARFVSAQGFGVERTILPRRTEPTAELLTLANATTLPPARAGKPASLPATNQGAGGPPTMPALNELSWMHLRGQIDFLGRLGVAKERRVAAGFGSHALHDVPRLSTKAAKQNDKESWLVRRVELVSMLMHEKPAVYLTGDVPRMAELANIKTRPVDDFEARAVASLRKGEDVVADATTNSIRMVGSIRATKQCLECHNTERGALLGAFSYRLERDPPALGK